MRKVASEAAAEQLRAEMLRLFQSTDPFDQPFRDEVRERLILSTNILRLYKEQFIALAQAVQQLGEKECAISEVEGSAARIRGYSRKAPSEYWIIDFTEYEAYTNLPIMWEHAIHSLRGEWGLIISSEHHAILGGSSRFMSAFKEFYPKWEQEREEFLEMWVGNRIKYGSKLDWLPGLLTHIYGEVGELPLLLRPQE